MPNTNLLGSFGDVSNSSLMFRNKIINGNFDIWQRGTSQTATGYGSDDRWNNDHVGSTKTTSRQTFTLGQTDVPNSPKYWSRTIVTSVANPANYSLKFQRVEDVSSLSGQTITLSFWAKADATKNIAVEFVQNFGTGGSPSATVTGIGVTTCALTTSWQKFTITTTLPSISGKVLGTNNNDALQVTFWFEASSSFNARTNSLGQQSGTFDIAQVQLEAGTVATPFEQRPVGLELSLCQRYFEQGIYSWIGNFTAIATQRFTIPYHSTKRAVPTTVNLTKGYSDGGLAGVNPSNVSSQTSSEGITVQFASTGASAQSEMTFSWAVSAEL